MAEPLLTSTRVRYGETDQMGFVYHANYVVYFELGRTEFMRVHGVEYAEMERQGMSLAVVDMAARFHSPAHYDELLEIETRLTDSGPVRVRFDYRVLRDGTLLCSGHTVLACLDGAGRPARIRSPWRERIAAARS